MIGALLMTLPSSVIVGWSTAMVVGAETETAVIAAGGGLAMVTLVIGLARIVVADRSQRSVTEKAMELLEASTQQGRAARDADAAAWAAERRRLLDEIEVLRSRLFELAERDPS